MTAEVVGKCQGRCPICGSENVDYEGSYLSNNSYIYDARCGDCGNEFSEYYDLVYAESIGYVEEEEL